MVRTNANAFMIMECGMIHEKLYLISVGPSHSNHISLAVLLVCSCRIDAYSVHFIIPGIVNLLSA